MRNPLRAGTVTPLDPPELAAILDEVRRAVLAVDEGTGEHLPLRDITLSPPRPQCAQHPSASSPQVVGPDPYRLARTASLLAGSTAPRKTGSVCRSLLALNRRHQRTADV